MRMEALVSLFGQSENVRSSSRRDPLFSTRQLKMDHLKKENCGMSCHFPISYFGADRVKATELIYEEV